MKMILRGGIILFSFLLAAHIVLAQEHYVHPGLPTGSNDGSSWENAWAEFSNIDWGQLQSEAATEPVTVFLKKGSVSNAPLIAKGSGSAQNRIVFTTHTSDFGPNPAIENATDSIDTAGFDYLTMENIEIRGSPYTASKSRGVVVRYDSEHITLRNLDIHDIDAHGIAFTVKGTPSGQISAKNTLVENSRIYNIMGSAASHSGIYGGPGYSIIRGNRIYRVCTDAIMGSFDNSVIEGNEIYQLGLAELGPKCPSTHPDAMQLTPQNITIRNNFLHDLLSQGIFLESYGRPMGNIEISNNIFINVPSGRGAINIKEANDRNNHIFGYIRVMNNSISRGSSVMTLYSTRNTPDSLSELDEVVFKNNAWGAETRGVQFGTSNSKSINLISNNNIIGNGSMNLKGTAYTTLEDWQSALGGCQGKENDCKSHWAKSPQFISPIDVHLQAGSMAINGGADLSEYFSADNNGTPRPQGAGWDIGAYEYYAGLAMQPIAPNEPAGTPPQSGQKCSQARAGIESPYINPNNCPIPIATKFDIKPDFNSLDITAITDLNLGILQHGKISWNDADINLTAKVNSGYDRLNLDADLNITKHKIALNQNSLPQLNFPAAITFYNTDFRSPKILKDGTECIACRIISYERSAKTIVFSVPGFGPN